MGMYTELVLKCEVAKGAPDEVHVVLNFLFNDAEEPSNLPSHEFFQCSRWFVIGRGNSYYHAPFSLSKYSEGYIFSRSDLKNYDDEIMKFLDWMTPYIDTNVGDCIGWEWHEEADRPTLLFKK